MNILILQGPNLNLLGLKASKNNDRLTLDKLNKGIRKFSNTKDVDLKTLQTHKQFQAINFLQRNRKWADGLLCIPTSWAKYDWSITETLNLINIPVSMVYFNDPFSLGTNETESIMTGKNIYAFSGQPVDACLIGIDHIIS